MENSVEFPQNPKTRNANNPTSGIYPKQLKLGSQRATCTLVFIAQLSIVIKIQE